MRTKLFLLRSLCAALVMTSCVKNPGTTIYDGDGVVSLKVPSGFTWATSANVTCNITAAEETTVAISMDAEGEPFAVFAVGGDNEAMTLTVPLAVSTLYVSYEGIDGFSTPQAVALSGKTLNFTVPSLRSAVAVTRAAVAPYVTYPASGWGTLFFEDLWPAYGDFDLNDMVIAYQVKLYPQNNNMGRQMDITIQVRAVGGSLPNTFYLALRGVKGGEIDAVTKTSEVNAATPTQLVATNNANNIKTPAILRFENIRSSSQQPKNVAYMNTMPGAEMADDQLLTASYHVEFRNSIKKENITFDLFDFFIARTDAVQKEIHLGGFTPILFGDDAYNSFAQLATSQERGEYYSKSGLVWGFTVPALIPHAYETIDFTQAYPRFAGWVQSGGASNADWYTTASGNRVNSNLVNP